MKLPRAVSAAALAMVTAVLWGCEKPLFPPNAERTPYERYERLHNKYRPLTEDNAFGSDQPALRARLRPLESP